MRFEFDAAKDVANIAKHGVSLARAEEFMPEVVEEDRRFDYAEVRYRAFGLLDELPHCLAFTVRGVVSFRRMHLKSTAAMSPEEIEAQLARLPDPDLTDPDNPEWTEETFARARPAAEVLPPEVLAAFGKPRGRPRSQASKVAVKLRLDPEVLAAFKAAGAGWQTRINAALLEAIAKQEV